MTHQILTPESVTKLAKDAFGENTSIEYFHDVQPAELMDIKDACMVSYTIDKP